LNCHVLFLFIIPEIDIKIQRVAFSKKEAPRMEPQKKERV